MNFDEQLSDHSLLTSLVLHESELHGLAVAAVIAKPGGNPTEWAELVESLRPGLCEQDSLVTFCRLTQAELASSEFKYQLLIDADEPLTNRVVALRFWITSFLSVFDQLDLWTTCCAPAEREELQHDFAAIALLDDNIESGLEQEQEEAFMQVVEFLRITTQSMFDYSGQQEESE